MKFRPDYVYSVREVITLRELVESSCELYTDNIAFTYSENDIIETVTYCQFIKDIRALATYLNANGFSGKLPKPRICVRDGDCNLSGLQNLAERLWNETQDPAAVSAYVFSFVGATLEAMTAALDEKMPGLPIVYAGGVMSNRFLQARLAKRANTYFAAPAFSADNAAGIALLCRRRFLTEQRKQ